MNSINKLWAGLGLAMTCFFVATSSVHAGVAGHVQFVNGNVQIISPTGQVRPAQKGEPINEGDTLTSALQSSAQIKMRDGGFVAVRPDTRMKFDQFVFAGKEDGSEKSFFSLFKGGFRAVTGLIGRLNKQNYRITTPAATIGIRGTDHETVVVTPDSPMVPAAPPGAYNRVNVGETTMTTDRGTINVQSNQMGYSGGMNQTPQILPVNSTVFTVNEAPSAGANTDQNAEDNEGDAEGGTGGAEGGAGGAEGGAGGSEGGAGGSEGGTGGAEGGTEGTAGATDGTAGTTGGTTGTTGGTAGGTTGTTGGSEPPLRTAAIVDTVAPSLSPPSPSPSPAPSLAPLPSFLQELPPLPPVVPTVPTYAPQAQAAADAALLSANATAAALSAITQADAALAVIAPVQVAPATTAIGIATTEIGLTAPVVASATALAPVAIVPASTMVSSASASVGAATPVVTVAAALVPATTATAIAAIDATTVQLATVAPAVTAATALLPVDVALATTNATAAQAARVAAEPLALAAQNAFAANGKFADALTAVPANNLTQTAIANLRAADTLVQGAATTVTAQNATLTNAQIAASTALANANANVASAQAALTTVTSQNAALTTSQAAATAALTTANTNLAAAQAELAAATTQNALLTAAQTAATTALGAANSNLTTANSSLTVANNQNAVIQAAQASAATQLAAAQTAATNAQAAAAAAAQAASQAVILQTAGDTAGAQAQLVIAQQQLALAQTAQAAAQAAQAAMDAQLVNARTAQAAANNAVASATLAANLAAGEALTASTQAANAQVAQAAATVAVTNATSTANLAAGDALAAQNQAITAQGASTAAGAAAIAAVDAATVASGDVVTAETQAVAAQTAATTAANELLASNTNLAAINSYATTVVDNASIAAYNNPAVVTLNRFVGVMSTIQPAAGGGFIEGFGPGSGFNGVGRANTSFVLDGAGNLVENRSAWYEQTPASSATPQLLVADANVKYTGGVAFDTFKLADNSIYGGRWQGGSITVTDNALVNPLAPFTNALGATSAHWSIMLAPQTNYVQKLVGVTSYSKAAATAPTDALGNAGVLNTATLTANFTTQLVDASLNLTISGKTLDVVAAGMAINGSFFSTGTQVAAACSVGAAACPGIYYANVGGGFAGDAAASAGLSYTLWTGTAPGATTGATDLIQGMVALTAATAPTPVVLPAPIAVVANPPFWADGYSYGVVVGIQPTATISNLVSIWGWGWGNNTIGLDAAANLVQINRAVLSSDYFSGGTALDTWKSADSAIYMGRWQGGSVTTVDYLGNLMSGPYMLGAGSAHWIVSALSPMGYAQTLQGTAIYNLTAATSPTDAAGNVGTLMPTSAITVNFTTQLVNIALDIQFANKSLSIVTPNQIAIDALNNDAIWGAGMVACTGIACDAGGYNADLRGRFSGATASSIALAYQIGSVSTIDLIQGAAAFDNAGLIQIMPYVAANTAVAYTSSMGGGFNFIATPTDLLPAGNPTYFREVFSQGWGYRAETLVGATTTITPVTTPNGISYGMWDSVTSVTTSSQYPLQPLTGAKSLPVYMYGEGGYLDAAVLFGMNTGPLTGTFTYQAAATTSYNLDNWATGTLTTATLSANFTTQTVAVALGGTMGANNWLMNSAAPISFMNLANGAGASFFDSVPVVTMNGMTCLTCGGNINGAFVGQNYAGAIVQYNLWENAAIASMNVGGTVAFDRMQVTTNPVVTNGVAAPTGTVVLATSWIDSPTAVTVDAAGVLTGWTANGSTTTVTPATGSVAQAAVGSGSGLINWGIWAVDSAITNSYSYVPQPGFGQFHWITAPEPTPIYLAEVLTTTNAAYTLVGGSVTSTSMTGVGVHGTISTASLAVNFTMQTVAVNLALAANGHNWLASTTNAPLQYLNNSNSMTAFYADSFRVTGQAGYLTVTVDGLPASGSLAGQLVGAALDGAILRFNMEGGGVTPVTWFEMVQGVAALQATLPNDPATPYRMVATAMNDPFATVPTLSIGGAYNNAARVVTDAVTGALLQFDNNPGGSTTNAGYTVQHVSGAFADQGSAIIGGAGISWGRWAPGTVVAVTDRVSGVAQNVTLTGGAHALVGPIMTGPVALPITGVYTYNHVGGTTPTTETGALGTLNSATLQANFTTQTVNVGVNVTAAGATLDAVGLNVPIMNRATFSAHSAMPGPGALTVNCTGLCGTTNQALIAGGFAGPGGVAAGVTYGFEKQGLNPGTVTGVAVFQQGAAQPGAAQ